SRGSEFRKYSCQANLWAACPPSSVFSASERFLGSRYMSHATSSASLMTLVASCFDISLLAMITTSWALYGHERPLNRHSSITWDAGRPFLQRLLTPHWIAYPLPLHRP